MIDIQSRQNVGMGLLFLFMVVFAVHHAGDFYVPDSDFFDFQDKAQAWVRGEMPENTKRLPMYSVVIAVVSRVMPGEHPFLLAAQWINVLTLLGTLILVFVISRRWLRAWAFWCIWFLALNPVILKMLVKPKAGMLALFWIVWAVFLYLKRHNSAYLVAFLASLTRYEGVFLIPAFVLADLFFSKQRINALVYGFLSSMGVVGWLLFNSLRSGRVNPYGIYFSTNPDLDIARFGNVLFETVVAFLPTSLLGIGKGVALLLFVAGFVVLARREKRISLVLFVFTLGYFVLHYIYWAVIDDYTVMILWLTILLIVLALVWMIHRVGEWSRIREFADRWQRLPLAVVLLMSGVAIVAVVWYVQRIEGGRLFGFAFAAIAAVHLWMQREWSSRLRTTVGVLLLSLVALIAFRTSMRSHYMMFHLRYSKAEYSALGDWYQSHYEPGDRLLVNQDFIVHFFTDLDLQKDFCSFGTIDAESEQDFLRELERKGVTYAAFVSHDMPEKSYHPEIYDWRYQHQKLYLLEPLMDGVSSPHFEWVETVKVGHRWAHIYRFKPSIPYE